MPEFNLIKWISQVPIEWGIFFALVYVGVQTKRCYITTLKLWIRTQLAAHESDPDIRKRERDMIKEDLERIK